MGQTTFTSLLGLFWWEKNVIFVILRSPTDSQILIHLTMQHGSRTGLFNHELLPLKLVGWAHVSSL